MEVELPSVVAMKVQSPLVDQTNAMESGTLENPDVDLLKEDVGNVPICVKLYGVPITACNEDGLSSIATKLGTSLMLDSYTSDMCLQSWGRSGYARVMIELQQNVEFKDTIVVAMPKIMGEGGNKKKGVEPTNEVSNLNPLEVLNLVDNDVELGDYDEYPYDDDIYEGQDRPQEIQVVTQVKIMHKANNKTIFCSFVYPALNMEDTYSGSSSMNSDMHKFKDCVASIEVVDINSSGHHITWNQKPKGGSRILKKLDRIMDSMLKEEEGIYMQAFNEVKLDEKCFLIQKAKVEWLEACNANPAYFHNNVPDAFMTHYELFLGNPVECEELCVDDMFVKKVSDISSSIMIHDITNEEIKVAMFDISDDHAPGPDGLNGDVYGFFKGKRRLRQGDLLSPYLFTLFMKVTLILQHSTHVIMDLLDKFKKTSGLVPSIPKSMAFFCNVPYHVKLVILDIMPFFEGELLVKCLGVPLISLRLLYKDFKILVKKAKNRIGDWRNKSLSFAERFLWCNGEYKREKAKVAWDVICLPKKERGLGLHSLDLFNMDLMTKASKLTSKHVWSYVHCLADMERVPPIMHDILSHLQPWQRKERLGALLEEFYWLLLLISFG
nr:hypothetical protein [Tanacetum cinerariifolium]